MSWWITVEDLVLPKQLAGHPALELVNTRAGWGGPELEGQDYLASVDHLVVLGRLNGLLGEERATRLRRRLAGGAEAERELARTRALRADLHHTVLGTATKAATRRLGRAMTAAAARQRLVIDDHSARWEFPDPPSSSDALDAFLVAAADLLVQRPRVDACPGTGCGWLFVNASGRRRWCQMAVCGNRAKQAMHASRARP
jgi:predicted RNA-binding Zn ribbon-like protein